MVVDLNKTAIGSWASYNIRIYPDEKYGWQMKSRWSLVGRDMNGVAVEMSVEDPGHSWNGEIVKLVLNSNPTTVDQPVKSLMRGYRGTVIGPGGTHHYSVPPYELLEQRFQKPDPERFVGTEEITVAAGTFKTTHYHYRESTNRDMATDVWVSEAAAPIGLVKVMKTDITMKKTERTMELADMGKGAKPTVTGAQPKITFPSRVSSTFVPYSGNWNRWITRFGDTNGRTAFTVTSECFVVDDVQGHLWSEPEPCGKTVKVSPNGHAEVSNALTFANGGRATRRWTGEDGLGNQIIFLEKVTLLSGK